MEKRTAALNTAGVIFLLIAILHIVRLIFGWEVRIGDFYVPSWSSLAAAGAAFCLSLWMFKSIR